MGRVTPFYAFLIFLSLPVFGSEQFLLEVGNGLKEEKQYVTRFYLILNSKQQIQYIEKRKYLQFEEEVISLKVYSIENILESVVLEERDGMEIITMKANIFSADQGGNLIISYLSNGIIKTYKKIELQLTFQQGSWILIGKNKEMVQSLFIHPNWILFLGTIGIREIEIISPKLECSEFISNPC